MKLERQHDENIKIMYEFVNGSSGDKKYYIKFRTYHFFGLFKMWWYVLHDTPFGPMHRPFYSMESVEKFIADNLLSF